MSTLSSSTSFGLEPAWDVARVFPLQGKWSVDDYLNFTDGLTQLVEYSAGHVEVLEVPTTAHQRILLFLYKLISRFVDDRDLGEVLAALRVQVAADVFREPDIVFVSRKHRGYVQERFWTGADLVVEIVSDDAKSRDRDYVVKRADYAAAGIAEYWIVDPVERRLTLLTLQGAEYVSAGEFKPGEHAASKLLDGLTIDVAATFKAAERAL